MCSLVKLLWSLHFSIPNSYTMFFVTVIPHAAVVHNFNTTEPVPVTDNVTEHFVVAIITIVLNDLNFTVSLLYFLYIFCFSFNCIFKAGYVFFDIFNRSFRTFYIFSSKFSSTLVKSSCGADGCNFVVDVFISKSLYKFPSLIHQQYEKVSLLLNL